MAATQLYVVYQGFVSRDSQPDTVDKDLDLWSRREERTPMNLGRFYTDVTSKTTTWNQQNFGTELDLPEKSEDTDPLPRTTPPTGYPLAVTIPTYRNSIVVTETAVDNDLSGTIMSRLGGFPAAIRKWHELKFANIFNNGFTVTTGGDGSFVWAADHKAADPRGGVWSNLQTAADLDSDSFDAMRVSMRGRKDSKGFSLDIALKALLVAPGQETLARQIAESDRVPETDANAKNTFMGVGVVTSPHLTDADAWWGQGDLNEDMWGMFRVSNKKFSVRRLGYPDPAYPNIAAGFLAYGRVEMGVNVAFNLHGNRGAA